MSRCCWSILTYVASFPVHLPFIYTLNFSLQANLYIAQDEAEEIATVHTSDLFSGNWHGFYNFDVKKRDDHLKQLRLPWVLRKVVSVMMKKEGTVRGVSRSRADFEII